MISLAILPNPDNKVAFKSFFFFLFILLNPFLLQ
nr:MAG TPA: hypothetical protein [Caudoviricetes sp.]